MVSTLQMDKWHFASPAPAAMTERNATMKRIEYRVEQMPSSEHPDQHIPELLERLTELGKQGWRAVSVDLTYHPSYTPAVSMSGASLPVLLEREVEA
jgi:hypothetical protein